MLQPSSSSPSQPTPTTEAPPDKAPVKKAPPAKASPASPEDRVENTLRPVKKTEWTYERARHLLWRAGFGGDEAQVRYLVEAGPEKAVDALLNVERVPADAVKEDQFDKAIIRPVSEEERQQLRRAQQMQDEDSLARLRLEKQRREREDRLQMGEVQKWWLRRMIETPRPLEERMTLFWHGLLATSFRTIENSYHMFLQNQLFRKHAMGSYSDLMLGLIRDPAMLAYLDNNDSRRNKPNENLAREIMELFSLGVGNYTEEDIKQGARALTGYTFEDDEFRFQKNNHDTGSKTILGQTGTWTGDDFVRIILEQQACSKYITRRLYHFFVADVPPDERGGDKDMDPAQRSVLRQLADSFRSGRYEVKPLLRRLFLSEHFYEPRFMNDQIKSPSVLVVGAVRSLRTPVRDLSILNDALDLMGQKIFYPPSVKGWDGGRSWINTSTYFVRQNILAFLLAGKKPQGFDASADTQPYDAMALLAPYGAESAVAKGDPQAVAGALLKLTLGWVPETPRRTLVEFAKSNDNAINNQTVTGMLLLITTMPEYQLC